MAADTMQHFEESTYLCNIFQEVDTKHELVKDLSRVTDITALLLSIINHYIT